MDFGNFYNYLVESGAGGPTTGKGFKELAAGADWFYIPSPTNGKDFGPKGKGTGKTKILVREKADKWDVFLLEQTTTAAMQKTSDADIATAKSSIEKRMKQSKSAKEESMDMGKLMSLAEDYLNGTLGSTLNEGEEGADDNGDTSMLNNASYSVIAEKTGMSFEDVLKVCVTAVTGEPQGGAGSELIKSLKA